AYPRAHDPSRARRHLFRAARFARGSQTPRSHACRAAADRWRCEKRFHPPAAGGRVWFARKDGESRRRRRLRRGTTRGGWGRRVSRSQDRGARHTDAGTADAPAARDAGRVRKRLQEVWKARLHQPPVNRVTLVEDRVERDERHIPRPEFELGASPDILCTDLERGPRLALVLGYRARLRRLSA